MRQLPAILALLAWLASAAVADAKGVESADACGASGCRSELDRSTVQRLLVLGRRLPPPRPGPFYLVHLRVRVSGNVILSDRQREAAREAFKLVYLPSSGAIRRTEVGGEPTWLRLDPAERRAFERVTAGLRPLPASRMDQSHEPRRPARSGADEPAGSSPVSAWRPAVAGTAPVRAWPPAVAGTALAAVD